MLKLLIYSEQEVRQAVEQYIDELYGDDGFEFDPSESYGFDSAMAVAAEAVSTLVERTKPNNGNYECVGYTFSADTEGVIQGYEFAYLPTRLAEIGAGFVSYKSMRPEGRDLDGLVEIAHYILAQLNVGINAMNELYASMYRGEVSN